MTLKKSIGLLYAFLGLFFVLSPLLKFIDINLTPEETGFISLGLTLIGIGAAFFYLEK